jgi:hypothetical protein
MRSTFILSALVGGVVLSCVSTIAIAQEGLRQPPPVMHMASLAPGSILGIVQDDRGLPVAGAIVSALGTTTAVAVTDRSGRFELRTLTPGPYLVRAHLSGYVASRGQVIEVRSSARTASSIALRRVIMPVSAAAPFAMSTSGTSGTTGSLPLVAAGLAGGVAPLPEPDAAPPDVARGAAAGAGTGKDDGGDSTATSSTSSTEGHDNHGEVAWRLRHARRAILKDVNVPEEIAVGDLPPEPSVFSGGSVLGYVGTPARLASSLMASTPFSGQVDLLTASSFETPQGLFTGDNFSRSIAYLAVGAPVGDRADWTVRAALTQGDLSSWIVAGEYTTRAPARHRYDLGWSYSTQHYDGGNFATLSEVTDGSRNAGAMYGFDTFSVTPSVTITYGAAYAHYDYLENRNLLSPRVSLTVEPVDHFRVSAMVSRRAVAPGAEELSPRMENAVWLPPQRTFASLEPIEPFQAEYTRHVELEVERDIAATTVSVRAFQQHTDHQLVTVFGLDVPGPASRLGHYFVGNGGNIDAFGLSAGIRASLAGRVHGSVEYSTARARPEQEESPYLWILTGSPLHPGLDRIHDVAASVVTDVPETSTRVLVVYCVSNAFAHPVSLTSGDHPTVDSRFDVQVRQSLPFMDFSTAKWEMLVGVRNFFRDTAPDQSIYDELLVVRPPKRVVGGLALRF